MKFTDITKHVTYSRCVIPTLIITGFLFHNEKYSLGIFGLLITIWMVANVMSDNN